MSCLLVASTVEAGIVLGLGGLVLILVIVAIIAKLVGVGNPSEMLIISGRRQRDGLGYRTLIGGRTLVIPVIEKVARLSLRNMQVALEVTAQSGGGTMMPVVVNGVANVKVSSDPSERANAIERFLSQPMQELQRVARETLEGGLRAVLNFGHTLGHAIEKVAGFGTVLHGEAVALGMPFALAWSSAAKGFDPKDAGRVVFLLAKFGLNIAALKPKNLDWRALRDAMGRDKKAQGGAVRFVLCDQRGHGGLPEEIPAADLDELLKGWCRDVVRE
jgi:hypothetical protein